MKAWIKAILCIGLLACCMQAASAFSVREISVPKTDLKANDNVQMEVEISIVAVASSHDFQFSSDLKNTTCVIETYNEEVNQYTNIQVDQDKSGRWLVMGWLLPSDRSFVLKLTFAGTVPANVPSGNITLLRISELASGATIAGGEYPIVRNVISPEDIINQIKLWRDNNLQFKTNITTIASAGPDASEALAKYSIAETALNNAESLVSTNAGEAQKQLDIARTSIQSGYNLLDKATAQYEIKKANDIKLQVESQIDYFVKNRSVSETDPKLSQIRTNYNLASGSITEAQNLIDTCQISSQPVCYIDARTKAADGEKFANEAYNISMSLRKDIGEGGFAINPLFLALGIIIIVVGVVGYFAYRKFFHWDELG